MSQAKNKKLKAITLEIDGENYECQITSWKINPPQNIGDKIKTFCPDGEFREDVDDDDWTLDLSWVTDWTTTGLNRVLWANRGETVPFTLVNHPTTTGWAVSWSGQVILQAPAAGGDVDTTEMAEITLTGVGDVPLPTYPVVP